MFRNMLTGLYFSFKVLPTFFSIGVMFTALKLDFHLSLTLKQNVKRTVHTNVKPR